MDPVVKSPVVKCPVHSGGTKLEKFTEVDRGSNVQGPVVEVQEQKKQ